MDGAPRRQTTRRSVLAGAPVIALLLLVLLLVVQLLPGTSAFLYLTAQSTELLQNTGILMLFGIGCFLLIILSIYWATTTVLALIIVTIPGMYPMRAMKLAGDIVTGRRMRILLRLLWQLVVAGLLWLAVLVPVVWLDAGLKSLVPLLDWVPLVPVTMLILATGTVMFVATYTYMLYRKVVEDDADPA